MNKIQETHRNVHADLPKRNEVFIRLKPLSNFNTIGLEPTPDYTPPPSEVNRKVFSRYDDPQPGAFDGKIRRQLADQFTVHLKRRWRGAGQGERFCLKKLG